MSNVSYKLCITEIDKPASKNLGVFFRCQKFLSQVITPDIQRIDLSFCFGKALALYTYSPELSPTFPIWRNLISSHTLHCWFTFLLCSAPDSLFPLSLYHKLDQAELNKPLCLIITVWPHAAWEWAVVIWNNYNLSHFNWQDLHLLRNSYILFFFLFLLSFYIQGLS